ncbi:MAG: HAMP domain-containing histidine kinase [Fibromonadaceae bacterium]|jgi:signal transduction histidine kinase|nr:HAMP domain-containing histidine kinase [Fibromonadaceae bacterium]
MVRGLASLAVPFRLLLFLAGILLATLVLAVIGFRSIKNEELIAEKKYEEAKLDFKNAVLKTAKTETERVIEEIQKIAEDLQDSLPGISSVFVFKDGALFPFIVEEESSEIYLLERAEALVLKEFLDLQEAGKFAESIDYAVKKVDSFLEKPSIARLNWDSYVLEKMLNDILSYENLSEVERRRNWDRLKKTKRLLKKLNTYQEHRNFLLALGNYASYLSAGHFFIQNNGKTFLTLSNMNLTAKKAIIAEIDSVFYTEAMNRAINETAREWSYIPFSISGNFPFGEWEIFIEEDSRTIHEESQKRIIILYLMLIFSLIIPVIGVVVVYRGFSRERQLRLMQDNFLSAISHELKTPLTAVEQSSYLIKRNIQINKPEKVIYHTDVIEKQVNRQKSLIDAILNYTVMESGKKIFSWESINLSECVESVCNSLDVIANSKGLEIRKEIESDCTITGDYSSIYSIVQNLVDNAIKYTAEGYISVKLWADAQGVSLSVADTGKGIPAKEQKNIFEGFYRIGDESTRETKGAGLGLAIVKRYADAHKAQIILKSAPEKGAVFTVVFRKLEV